MSETSIAKAGAPASTSSEPALRPNVEVFEDDEGINLIADLPGVAPRQLNVQVDKETLLIEGKAELPVPDDMQVLHAEVRHTLYRRSFALSSELDPERIQAQLRDGVLRLHIPKRSEVRPRKIEVRVD